MTIQVCRNLVGPHAVSAFLSEGSEFMQCLPYLQHSNVGPMHASVLMLFIREAITQLRMSVSQKCVTPDSCSEGWGVAA